jgi:hypothetical protein
MIWRVSNREWPNPPIEIEYLSSDKLELLRNSVQEELCKRANSCISNNLKLHDMKNTTEKSKEYRCDSSCNKNNCEICIEGDEYDTTSI